MSEPIIVAGRECHFTDAGDDAPSWVITSKPFGESGDFLKPSGRWERDIAADEVYGWPTEAAAREFASSIAARSQPAEVADGWLPIDSAPKDGTRIIGCCLRLLGEDVMDVGVMEWAYNGFSMGWKCPTMCMSQVEPTHWQPLPTPPVPQEPDRT